MIDFFKIFSLPITILELLNNHLFDFPKNVNETGEINNRNQSVKYRNLWVTINQSRNVRKLKGSLHMFWNRGTHNHNDFTYIDLVKTILELANDLKIDPKKSVLNHIEYAVNLLTNFDPSDLIHDLILHKGVPFYRMKKGIGMRCTHEQYSIKIYNKGYQKHLSCYVLRIEIKVNAMYYLEEKGIPIRTLDDLMNLDNLKKLGQNLLERFNEILFDDSTIITEDLTKDEQLILSNGRNPKYWAELDKNKTDQFRRHYKTLYNLSAKRKWQQIVAPLIEDKLKELLSEVKPPMKSPVKCSEVDDETSIQNINTPTETTAYISDSVPSGKTLSMANVLFDTKSSDGALYDSDSSKKISSGSKISDSVLCESDHMDKNLRNGEVSDSVLFNPLPSVKTKRKTKASHSVSQLNLF
jgi:hypothetical protein